MALHVGPGFELPKDAITQTFGILAVRGAGKSNLAAVMAEEMHAARLPFVVVDPVGAWYGLRSAGDGKGPGLPIPIFGGRHGDVPLERTAGTMLADLVVGDRLSCVLDVSEFSEGDKVRFLIDFAERLYRANQQPLHLFLEEADDYAPQKPRHEQARLLGAWENIVRRGRARGLGITMITQRSAVLNKNVLTQIETLFVLRTTSPQDRKAIEAWVEYHGQAKDLVESLPGLEAGEAWVWSPSWLRKCERIRVRRRATFDSGATPKGTASRAEDRPPATLADVDLAAIQKRMQATIERAKTEDPRELRKRIAELERELKAARAAAPKAEIKIKQVEVPLLKGPALARLTAGVGRGLRLAQALEAVATTYATSAGEINRQLTAAIKAIDDQAGQLEAPPRPAAPAPPAPPAPRLVPARRAAVPAAKPGNGDARITPAQQRILDALAWLQSVGIGQANRTQLALLADASPTSSSYANNLGALRSGGFIDYASGAVLLTRSGAEHAVAPEQPWTTDQIQRSIIGRMSPAKGRIVRALIDTYPNGLARDELAARSAQSPTSSSFANNLGSLRSLGIIDYIGRDVVAKPLLFLEGH